MTSIDVALERREWTTILTGTEQGGPKGSSRAACAKGSLDQVLESIDPRAGQWMHEFASELYPICRSITGDGLRQTLRRIGSHIPLDVREVPTGTRVFDWIIPKEWNIRDAWLKNAQGEKVIDFKKSNLHVVQYSAPVRCRLSLADLRPRLHTLPDCPDWVPYRTSYYKENWGFCLTHNQLMSLPEGEYEACIDARLEDGSLTYGECYLPGRRDDEVLLSCHTCHPSLCNDNLSGVALMTMLAKLLVSASLEYSYRFLFIPGTIGSIAWLARNQNNASRIRHGLVAACVGDSGKFHYKRSRRGNAEIDRAARLALRHSGQAFEILDFSPYGYDERQYCSPGFNLAVGSLSRTPHGRFPQYHTSADDLDFVHPETLAGSLAAYLSVLRIIENNASYINLNPHCEPQLGRRGLYGTIGGRASAERFELAMLWVLNMSGGSHSLLDIAERSDLDFALIHQAARTLVEAELLRPTDSRPGHDDLVGRTDR